VSTINGPDPKIYTKIEGVTGKKCDVIFICDVRMGDMGSRVEQLFNITKNGSYKLYFNSSKESRGVAIAIKRNVAHEVLERFDSVDENVLLLKVKIKGHVLTLGSLYGTNENNENFYNNVKVRIEGMGVGAIIGGDFNTILDRDRSNLNLDREGNGRVPNLRNSNVLNGWINDNFMLDPFRALYPERKGGFTCGIW
jgi:exonuclease III